MIVSYLDFDGTCVGPDEADAIPVVDANAVLPASVPGQSFQPVAGRYAEIAQDCGGIELVQLSLSHTPNCRRASTPRGSSVPPVENVLGAATLGDNHDDMVARQSCYSNCFAYDCRQVKRDRHRYVQDPVSQPRRPTSHPSRLSCLSWTDNPILELHERPCYHSPMNRRPHTRHASAGQRPKPCPKVAQTASSGVHLCPKVAPIRCQTVPPLTYETGSLWNTLQRFFALRPPAQLGSQLLRPRSAGGTNRPGVRAPTHARR